MGMSDDTGLTDAAPRRAIGDDERPAVRAEVDAATLDGEVVVYNAGDGRVHQLDRLGSLLWDLLDGSATVRELVDDVADAFGAPRDDVDRDVKAFVAELDHYGLLEGSEAAEPHPSQAIDDETWIIEAPSPCAPSADLLPWGAVVAVEVGSRWAGVRLPSPEVAERFQAVWTRPTRLQPDAPPSVHLLPAEDSSRLHRMHRNGCLTASTGDPRRLVITAARHLAATLPAPLGTARFQTLAVVRDGVATLLPSLLDERLLHHQRRLREHGFLVTDAPASLLDLDTGELVVAPDDLLDPDELDGLAAAFGHTRRVEPVVEPGRYRVDRWFFLDVFGPERSPLPTSDAVRYALSAAREPAQPILEALTRLLGSIRTERINPSYDGSTVDILLDRVGPA